VEHPSLDPNHTHFILVDDGTQPEFAEEVVLRQELERYVSHYKKTIGGESRSHIVIAIKLYHNNDILHYTFVVCVLQGAA